MKKTLAILLALLLVLVNVAALADASAYLPVVEGTTKTIKLNKAYTLNGNTTNVQFPAEKITFEAKKIDGPAYDGLISASVFTVDAKEKTDPKDYYDVTITFPQYTLPGLYHYELTEKPAENATQGVTYDPTPIKVSVLVVFDTTENGNPMQLVVDAVGFTKVIPEGSTEGVKDDKLDNIYDLGKLTVEKKVSGNMADTSNPFKITVTLTSDKAVRSAITVTADDLSTTDIATIPGDGWTGEKVVSLTIKHNGKVVFSDLPAGVTYTVAESDDHIAPDANGSNGNIGYERTYDDNKSGTISATNNNVTTKITNKKSMEIDTGMNMETVPYIMLLAVAMIGIAVLKLRKREEY